ncbi:uncharacterized protein METZ01_LOCUS113898, partial [marine metagenome]
MYISGYLIIYRLIQAPSSEIEKLSG